jgi:hypothetical protein
MIRSGSNGVGIFASSVLAATLLGSRDFGSANRTAVVLLQPLCSALFLAWELHDELVVLERVLADGTVYTVLSLDLRVLLDRKGIDGSVGCKESWPYTCRYWSMFFVCWYN